MAADGVWTHQATAPRRVVVVGTDLILQRRLALETMGVSEHISDKRDEKGGSVTHVMSRPCEQSSHRGGQLRTRSFFHRLRTSCCFVDETSDVDHHPMIIFILSLGKDEHCCLLIFNLFLSNFVCFEWMVYAPCFWLH